MEKIPLLSGDVADKAIIDPKVKASNRLHLAGLNLKMPERVILTFFRQFYDVVKNKYNPQVYEYHNDFSIYVFKYNGKEVALLYPTMGSYASMILEEMIALGGKKIIFLGGVGTLSGSINRGELILPVKAIRDEGISYQYEKESFFSYPSEKLLGSLKKTLDSKGLKYNEGATWTVATCYRETEEKLDKFIKKGAICTEIEAASFFSIAKYRNVDIAGLFIAGDSIAGKRWGALKTKDNICNIVTDREKLLDIALEALCK